MKQFLLFWSFLCACFIASSVAQEFGEASIFADNFQGKKTASGELYDMNKLTAAHKSFPFGSKLKITRLDNKQSVVVRVNDRGPYIKGRVVELSRKAAREIGLTEGEVKVRVELVEKANSNEDIRPPKPAPLVEVPNAKNDLTSKGDDKKKKAVVPKKETKPTVTPKEYTTAPTPESAKTTSKDAPAETAKNFAPGELYKINLLKPERDGYGLQVAVMKDVDNAMRKVAELQKDFFKNVLMMSDKSGYKIILGPFPDVATAESYKKSAKKKKMQGFIINLKTMEKM